MQSHRLPTRVSSACDRCRKLKQRCDVLRPCSNCIHANRECVKTTPPRTSSSNDRPVKRARRAATSSPAITRTGQLESLQTGQPRSPKQLTDDLSPMDHHRASLTPMIRSTPSNSWLTDASWEDRSIVAEFGSSSSAMDITRRVLRTRGSDQSADRATFAIPGGDFNARRQSAVTTRTISDLIGVSLPPRAACDKLLDIYFVTTHWFSLVVYEPTFRKRYRTVISSNTARTADRPFLLLLLMVLVMSCQYGNSTADEELRSMVDLNTMRVGYLKIVRQNFMDLLDEDSLEFVQICTLLGSYWLYWGKPRSSFTILGAAVKSAQAISLHRQANWRLAQSDIHMVEESKRVWWTIYTWDRFATIVYGRPLGISDKDCDVLMPAEYSEHLVDPQTAEEADITLSMYQVQLNTVYQIASPLLENIYGIRNPGDRSLSEMAQTVRRVNDSMQVWCHELPVYLDLDKSSDLPAQSSLQDRMHRLQALSLRLTYLNLMIIIHRPLLADWRSRRTRESRAQSLHGDHSDDVEELTGPEKQIYDAGFQQCLKAAVAVSQLERSKSNLIRLAGTTHLVSFLAMNVFTSSVVLFICALSDTLSDASQEAKRGMSRNLRILRSLSDAGSLPHQCGTIIQDLIQMVMDREKEQMLLGPLDAQDHAYLASRSAQSRLIGQPRTGGADQYYNGSESGTTYSQPSGPHINLNFANLQDTSGTPLERTMEQLHKVLKNTSQVRASQRAEACINQPTGPSYDQSKGTPTSEPAWPNAMSWDAGYMFGGETYAQDMNQFWLWDMDNENQTSWAGPGWDA